MLCLIRNAKTEIHPIPAQYKGNSIYCTKTNRKHHLLF